MKESTRQLFKVNRWRIDRSLHGYVYFTQIDHYIKYMIRLARKVRPRTRYLLDYMFSHYHCKVLTEEQAERLLTVNQDIVVDPERSSRVMPFRIAHDIVLSQPLNIVVLDCGCRLEQGIKDEPLDVCFVVGEPAASFVLEHGARHHARKISPQEAIEIMQRERKNGCIPTAWFKDVAGERFFAICNCRPGRCAALEAVQITRTLQLEDPPHVAVSSGYIAQADRSLCNGCKSCVQACPFKAIALDDEDKAEVVFDLCMGCGLCVDTCKESAISLVRDERKAAPLDVAELV